MDHRVIQCFWSVFKGKSVPTFVSSIFLFWSVIRHPQSEAVFKEHASVTESVALTSVMLHKLDHCLLTRQSDCWSPYGGRPLLNSSLTGTVCIDPAGRQEVQELMAWEPVVPEVGSRSWKYMSLRSRSWMSKG